MLNTIYEYAGHMFLIYPTRNNTIITEMAIPQCALQTTWYKQYLHRWDLFAVINNWWW